MSNETPVAARIAAAAGAAPAVPLMPGQRPPAASYDVALLDLDGVVYSGPDPIDGAVDALAAARKAGLRLAVVTNHASKSPSGIAEHLNQLRGIARSCHLVTFAPA